MTKQRPRHEQIIALAAAGFTNQQIADTCGFTVRTLDRDRKKHPELGDGIKTARAALAAETLRPCGTLAAYRRGCRCDRCRATNAAHHRATIANRRGKPIPAHVEHGRAHTYTNWHCRCAPCTKAATDYNRPYANAWRQRVRKGITTAPSASVPTEPREPVAVSEQIEQALARGRTASWIMAAFGVDYATVKTARDTLDRRCRMSHACTYRQCTTPATTRLQPSSGGRPWYGCNQHAPAMEKALYVGLPGGNTGTAWVTVTDLDRKGT